MNIDNLPGRYWAGRASVEAGGTIVTPHDAAWAGNVWGDDLFFLASQPLVPPQRVAEVNGDGELVLANPWPGAGAEEEEYEVRYVGIVERSTAQTRRYLEMLGQLAALGIQPNAFGVGSDRDAFDAQRKGFFFLDIGNPWTLYVKSTDADGDWSSGQPMEGAPGPQGTNVVWRSGAGVPSGATGANGDMYLRTNGDVYGPKAAGAWGGIVVSLIGPGGNDGDDGNDGVSFVWRGSYSSATAYQPNDVVENNGSSWIAIQPTTGNNPPTLPTTANDWWQLSARAGANGAGTVSNVGAGAGINIDASNPAVPVVEVEPNLQTWNGIAPSANVQALVSAATYAAMRALLDLEAGTDFYSKTGADAAFQPSDTDLSAIAALTTTSYGRAFLTLANQAALMALLSLSSTTAAGLIEQATAAEVRSGAADRAVSSNAAQEAMAFQTLTDGGTVAINHKAGTNWKLVASAARVFTVTNLTDGLPLNIRCEGNFAHSFSTDFDFGLGGVPSVVSAYYTLFFHVQGGKARFTGIKTGQAA